MQCRPNGARQRRNMPGLSELQDHCHCRQSFSMLLRLLLPPVLLLSMPPAGAQLRRWCAVVPLRACCTAAAFAKAHCCLPRACSQHSCHTCMRLSCTVRPSPCFIMSDSILMSTLEEGRSSTCFLPRFSALYIVFCSRARGPGGGACTSGVARSQAAGRRVGRSSEEGPRRQRGSTSAGVPAAARRRPGCKGRSAAPSTLPPSRGRICVPPPGCQALPAACMLHGGAGRCWPLAARMPPAAFCMGPSSNLHRPQLRRPGRQPAQPLASALGCAMRRHQAPNRTVALPGCGRGGRRPLGLPGPPRTSASASTDTRVILAAPPLLQSLLARQRAGKEAGGGRGRPLWEGLLCALSMARLPPNSRACTPLRRAKQLGWTTSTSPGIGRRPPPLCGRSWPKPPPPAQARRPTDARELTAAAKSRECNGRRWQQNGIGTLGWES